MNDWIIAVCDDEKVYREQVMAALTEYRTKQNMRFEIIEYTSGKELIKQCDENYMPFNMVFLDVDMPGMNGVEAAQKLRDYSEVTAICFVTSYENYAYEAFGVNAVDYIVKPIMYDRLERIMMKAAGWYRIHKERLEAEKRFVEIHKAGETEIVDSRDLLYVEKRRNQCILHFTDRSMECYDTLSNLYERLDKTIFCYCHQGYLVNFYQIKEIRDNTAFLSREIFIPVSRKYYIPLKERFNDKLERAKKEIMREFHCANGERGNAGEV